MTNFYSERTVKWEDDKVVLIDQTKLPNNFIYIRCNNYNEVAQAIRTMAVRGAPAIGATASFGLALAAKHSKAKNKVELLTDLEEASDVIKNTRPTAINLFWALQRIMNLVKKTKGNVKKLVEVAKEEAIKIAEEDVQVNHVLGKIGSELLNHGDIVLTHCKWHTGQQSAGALATVGYGTALGIIRAAIAQGKHISVIATETRPLLQGSRLTAYELLIDKIPVTLITDTMVGFTMQKGMVTKVIVGADRITKLGHTFNKIGTYQVAVLAKKHNIPFFVAAPISTFD